jgi:SWIM/SEC-C metal-binding protein
LAKLGTRKRPAVVRVRTVEKAEAIVGLCSQHDWQVIVGIEEDEPEDTSDVNQLLSSLSDDARVASKLRPPPKISGNDYCPCGTGKKFKKCCGAQGSPS